ncbi:MULTISPECIES: hypothetical protein [Enterococcus]|uniref:Uncharacterized protein n=1 Tax=Candidatus Enterococcus mangumiae TaxID=2230878 RepID=A0ABZ2T0M5_9ENTE|nr:MULTISPECIES: hypothetical protein [unclassified Enterococcus]MBO0460837.1 hypothetical protein [Enterococcus sp. DIV1298c]MBO0491188.1 hypothetical protein [Enterococcus sp. DIV1094]MBO1299910.1 hypothetical protein [Enterococcus sp. DIV1271a]
MTSETIVLGQKYVCNPIGIKNKVVGEVIGKLENCVIMSVEEYDRIDHLDILEKGGKVVAKYTDIYELNAFEQVFQAPTKLYTQAMVS